MKRTGAIACLVALLVMLTSAFCFGASNLTVTTYPEDGQKNTTKDNMVVKLYFNNPVGNKKSAKANEKTFKIVGKNGKELPTIIKYNPEDNTQAMVLVNTNAKGFNVTKDILDDSEYTMTLSKNFVDNKGNTLDKDLNVTFKTMNQGRSTKIYMIMMVVMFVGMFVFSSISMKKQHQKEEAGEVKEAPFNPYKEAKRTGKSVEEVTAAYEKEQAKKAAKAARKASKEDEDDDDDDDDYDDDDKYKVKGPRPISAGGSAFVTGRKAIAEAKAAEIEKRKQQQAAAKKKK